MGRRGAAQRSRWRFVRVTRTPNGRDSVRSCVARRTTWVELAGNPAAPWRHYATYACAGISAVATVAQRRRIGAPGVARDKAKPFGVAAPGVHESIIPAAVAPMASPKSPSFGVWLFTGAYGIAWFLGSVAIGALFNVSLGAVVTFAVIAELAAIP